MASLKLKLPVSKVIGPIAVPPTVAHPIVSVPTHPAPPPVVSFPPTAPPASVASFPVMTPPGAASTIPAPPPVTLPTPAISTPANPAPSAPFFGPLFGEPAPTAPAPSDSILTPVTTSTPEGHVSQTVSSPTTSEPITVILDQGSYPQMNLPIIAQNLPKRGFWAWLKHALHIAP